MILTLMLLIANAPAPKCTAASAEIIICSGEQIRLAGIKSLRRKCLPGISQQECATSWINHELKNGLFINIERVGHDSQGRTLAVVQAGGAYLSCEHIWRSRGRYVRKLDPTGKVAELCGVHRR